MREGRYLSLLPALFWCGVLILVWVQVTFLTYPGYWLVDEEMAVHTLGHAAYIDNWLVGGGGHPSSYYQFLHPGVPLQLVCWVIYRLTAPNPLASAQDIFRDHLLNPEPFHLATQTVGLLITLLALLLFWKRSRPLGIVATFVVLALPSTSEGNWAVSFWRLDSDTFSLLLAAGLAWALRRALRGSLSAWAWLGALLATAYLTKLNHLPWIVGVGIGWAVSEAVNRNGWRLALKSAASVAAGFIGAFAIGAIIMGRGQVLNMFIFQWRVATHTGRYGEGGSGLLDKSTFVPELLLSPSVLIAVGLSAAILLVCWQRRKNLEWRSLWLAEGVALSCALLLGVLILARHAMPHYFVPAAALLPVAALWLFEAWTKRAALLLLLPSLFGISNAHLAWKSASIRPTISAERQAELAEIEALPIAENALRLWTFKVPSQHYIRRFAVQLSGVKSLADVVDAIQPQDQEFNIWRGQIRVQGTWRDLDELAWQRAIFETRYFQNAEHLPEQFRNHGYSIIQRKHFLWVERPPGNFLLPDSRE